VNYVSVVKATQNMQDGIALADIRKELIAKAFTPASTLNQTSYVNNVDGGRDGALGMAYFGEDLQTAVRNIGGTQIGLDSAEGEVGTLGLAAAHAVEESGFTHIRKAYYTAF
jgi:hypothetical protein